MSHATASNRVNHQAAPGRNGPRGIHHTIRLIAGRTASHGEAWPAEALAVAGTLIVTRIVWVFAVVQRRSGVRRPSWPVPAVVSWAGTRGVVPLAAALSIPLTSASGAPLPQRDLILVLATAVIVVSLVLQGLTLEPLVRLAGIARPVLSRVPAAAGPDAATGRSTPDPRQHRPGDHMFADPGPQP